MSQSEPELDRCGCCAGDLAVEPVRNDPGLPALRYRIGTWSSFLTRMLHALPRAQPDDAAGAPRPLADLTARTPEDPTVALLDSVACVADVLTFYQERIANEGYLRTATERRSVLELARAIGYELKPGVAASVYLSFDVESAEGAPQSVELASGFAIQSVPGQDELPQVFETSSKLRAYAAWNEIRPRLTRPADMAILTGTKPEDTLLVLLGPSKSFPPTTTDLLPAPNVSRIYRLDPSFDKGDSVDALPVTRVYLDESVEGPAQGDVVLFTGRRGQEVKTLVLRAASVKTEPDLARIRVDLEPLPKTEAETPLLLGVKRIPFIRTAFTAFSRPRLRPLTFDRDTVRSTVLRKTWRERDLRALMGIQRWPRISLLRAVRTKTPAEPLPIEPGAFGFGQRLGFFGNNAPKWGSLPKAASVKEDPYPQGWDKGDGASPQLSESRTIWMNSQGDAFSGVGPHAYLERAVKGLAAGGWAIIDSPSQDPEAYRVYDAREASRADFGLSGRATGLTLANAKGEKLQSLPSATFRFRTTTAHVDSRRFGLAELPIDSPVEKTKTIELDEMVLGLQVGQAIALVGERFDLPGVEAAEIAFLEDIVHSDGRTTLVFEDEIEHAYVRDRLVLNANVVHATHGETVREVLGSGDASLGNQRFLLKKPPLTYVSAPTAKGAESSLVARVNGVKWSESGSLYPAGPDDETYTVRIDDDANAVVIFGDGRHGARVPTGATNVSAEYRSGIGPEGEVPAGSLTMLRERPLGLKSVTNALAASGAEGPEKLADARENAPLTVRTFERIVSVVDYEDFARSYPGIGKARGDVLWIGGSLLVYLTVGGATGGLPSPDVVTNLRLAIARSSDPSQRFRVGSFTQRYFTCKAYLEIDDRYVAEVVLAVVNAQLREAYSFERRGFGASVTAADAVSTMHEVAGVVAVDLEELRAYSDDESESAPVGDDTAVPAFPARWDRATETVLPADLLLINPVGIVLEEMSS